MPRSMVLVHQLQTLPYVVNHVMGADDGSRVTQTLNRLLVISHARVVNNKHFRFLSSAPVIKIRGRSLNYIQGVQLQSQPIVLEAGLLVSGVIV